MFIEFKNKVVQTKNLEYEILLSLFLFKWLGGFKEEDENVKLQCTRRQTQSDDNTSHGTLHNVRLKRYCKMIP